MTQEDLRRISSNWLKSLTGHCETLITENRAGLEEYELYVRCKIELLRRGEGVPAGQASVRERGPVTAQYHVS